MAGRGFAMAKTETVEYVFTVKEGPPLESGGEAPAFLACEPRTERHSFLGSDGFLTIELSPGTSVDRAEDIAAFLNENVAGISVTTF